MEDKVRLLETEVLNDCLVAISRLPDAAQVRVIKYIELWGYESPYKANTQLGKDNS